MIVKNTQEFILNYKDVMLSFPIGLKSSNEIDVWIDKLLNQLFTPISMNQS